MSRHTRIVGELWPISLHLSNCSLQKCTCVCFSRSVVSDSLQPHGLQHARLPNHASSFSNTWSLLKPMSIELVMPSNLLILYCPLLLPPLIFLSIRVFSNELVLHMRWPKYWSFSFSISHSNKYSWLISFRIDCFDLQDYYTAF